MKNIFLLALLFLAMVQAEDTPAQSASAARALYGTEFSVAKPIAPHELTAFMEGAEQREAVQLKGYVAELKNEGAYQVMQLRTANDFLNDVTVRFPVGKQVLPASLKGKTVVVAGTLVRKASSDIDDPAAAPQPVENPNRAFEVMATGIMELFD